MNLIDAARSGREIKRLGWQNYYRTPISTLSREDILADDWELIISEVLVTSKSFWESAAAIFKEMPEIRSTESVSAFSKLFYRLGFKD